MRWQKQVTKLGKIKLDHVALQLDTEVGHLSDNVEHPNDSPRGEARVFFVTLDGECLSWASLSVSKDADIVAIDCTLNKTIAIFKDLILCRFLIKYCIKIVFFGSTFASRSTSNSDWHLISFIIAPDVFLRIFQLTLRERSDSAVDTHLSFQVFKFIEKLFPLGLLFLVFGRHLVELSCAFFELLLDQSEFFLQSLCLMGSLTKLFSLFLQISVFFLQYSYQFFEFTNLCNLIGVSSLHIFEHLFQFFKLYILLFELLITLSLNCIELLLWFKSCTSILCLCICFNFLLKLMDFFLKALLLLDWDFW